MPFKSDILNDIIFNNTELFESLYNNLETKCIVSDFNLLEKKNRNTKLDFFYLIAESLKIEKSNNHSL